MSAPKPAIEKKKISLKVGEYIDVLDQIPDGRWCKCLVLDINRKAKELLVHYEGWKHDYDEWICMPTRRIAPISTHTIKGHTNPPPDRPPPKTEEERAQRSVAGALLSDKQIKNKLKWWGKKPGLVDLEKDFIKGDTLAGTLGGGLETRANVQKQLDEKKKTEEDRKREELEAQADDPRKEKERKDRDEIKRQAQEGVERPLRAVDKKTTKAERDADAQQQKLLNAIGVLVKVGGAHGQESQKRQAAMGFAQFSNEEEGQWAIANYKDTLGIETLVGLMSCQDVVAQQHAVFALGNIASQEVNRPKLAAAGCIDALAAMAVRLGTNVKARRSCTYALANLAASPSTHSDFFPWVKDLLTLADDIDHDVVKYASLIIQNLAANEMMWPPLIEHRALGSLMNILSADGMSEESQLHSIAAIQSLSVDDKIKRLICAEGMIQHVMRGLKHTPPRVLAEMVATIAKLSTVDITHSYIVDVHVLKSIFSLLNPRTSLDVHYHVADILANLAQNEANHLTISTADGVSYALSNMQSIDAEVRHHGIRALAWFSLGNVLHQELLQTGAIDAVVPFLKSVREPKSRLLAALFCALLSEDAECLVAMSHPALVETLLYLAFRSHDPPIELVKNVVLSLANIAAAPSSHGLILREIDTLGFDRFLALVNINDPYTIHCFALLLSNLASDRKNHNVINARQFIRTVVDMIYIDPSLRNIDQEIYDFQVKTVRACLSFLYQICRMDPIRSFIASIAMVALTEVGLLLESEDDQLLLASLLADFAIAEPARASMVTNPKVQLEELACRYMSLAPYIETRRAIMMMIARISETEALQNAVFQSDMRALVVKNLSSMDEMIEASSLRCLANFTSNRAIASLVNELNLDAVLSASLRSPFSQCRKFALTTLGNFGGQPRAKFSLEEARVVDYLMNLFGLRGRCELQGVELIEEKSSSVFALANGVFHPTNHPYVLSFGSELLLALFNMFEIEGSADPAVRRAILQFFTNVTSTQYKNRIFTDTTISGNVIKMGRFINDDRQRFLIISTLRNIALSSGNAAALSGVEIGTYVHKQLTDGQIGIDIYQAFKEEVLHLLYHLSFSPETAIQIVKEKIVPICLSELTSMQPKIRVLCRNTLVNLCVLRGTQKPLILCGGVQSLFETLLEAIDTPAHDALAFALFGLTATMECRSVVMSVLGEDIVYRWILAMLNTGIENMILSGLWALVQLLATVPEGASKVIRPPPPDIVRALTDLILHANVVEKQHRLAFCALANLSFHHRLHKVVVEVCPELLHNIFDISDRGDLYQKRYIALFLANLVTNVSQEEPDYFPGMPEEKLANSHKPKGVVALLAELELARLDVLLGSDDEETMLHTVYVIEGLSRYKVCVKQMLSVDTLVSLLCVIAAAPNATCHMRRHIAGALFNLSSHTFVIADLLRLHVLGCLIHLSCLPTHKVTPLQYHVGQAQYQTHYMKHRGHEGTEEKYNSEEGLSSEPVYKKQTKLLHAHIEDKQRALSKAGHEGMNVKVSQEDARKTLIDDKEMRLYAARCMANLTTGRLGGEGLTQLTTHDRGFEAISCLIRHDEDGKYGILIETIRLLSACALYPQAKRYFLASRSSLIMPITMIAMAFKAPSLDAVRAMHAADDAEHQFVEDSDYEERIARRDAKMITEVMEAHKVPSTADILYHSAIIVRVLCAAPSLRAKLLHQGILPLIFKFCLYYIPWAPSEEEAMLQKTDQTEVDHDRERASFAPGPMPNRDQCVQVADRIRELGVGCLFDLLHSKAGLEAFLRSKTTIHVLRHLLTHPSRSRSTLIANAIACLCKMSLEQEYFEDFPTNYPDLVHLVMGICSLPEVVAGDDCHCLCLRLLSRLTELPYYLESIAEDTYVEVLCNCADTPRNTPRRHHVEASKDGPQHVRDAALNGTGSTVRPPPLGPPPRPPVPPPPSPPSSPFVSSSSSAAAALLVADQVSPPPRAFPPPPPPPPPPPAPTHPPPHPGVPSHMAISEKQAKDDNKKTEKKSKRVNKKWVKSIWKELEPTGKGEMYFHIIRDLFLTKISEQGITSKFAGFDNVADKTAVTVNEFWDILAGRYKPRQGSRPNTTGTQVSHISLGTNNSGSRPGSRPGTRPGTSGTDHYSAGGSRPQTGSSATGSLAHGRPGTGTTGSGGSRPGSQQAQRNRPPSGGYHDDRKGSSLRDRKDSDYAAPQQQQEEEPSSDEPEESDEEDEEGLEPYFQFNLRGLVDSKLKTPVYKHFTEYGEPQAWQHIALIFARLSIHFSINPRFERTHIQYGRQRAFHGPPVHLSKELVNKTEEQGRARKGDRRKLRDYEPPFRVLEAGGMDMVFRFLNCTNPLVRSLGLLTLSSQSYYGLSHLLATREDALLIIEELMKIKYVTVWHNLCLALEKLTRYQINVEFLLSLNQNLKYNEDPEVVRSPFGEDFKNIQKRREESKKKKEADDNKEEKEGDHTDSEDASAMLRLLVDLVKQTRGVARKHALLALYRMTKNVAAKANNFNEWYVAEKKRRQADARQAAAKVVAGAPPPQPEPPLPMPEPPVVLRIDQAAVRFLAELSGFFPYRSERKQMLIDMTMNNTAGITPTLPEEKDPPSNKFRVLALSILANISVLELNHPVICNTPYVLDTFVNILSYNPDAHRGILRNGSPVQPYSYEKRLVMEALANISATAACHMSLTKAGAVQMLMELLNTHPSAFYLPRNQQKADPNADPFPDPHIFSALASVAVSNMALRGDGALDAGNQMNLDHLEDDGEGGVKWSIEGLAEGAVSAKGDNMMKLTMSMCKITSHPEFVFESASSGFIDCLLILLQTQNLQTQHFAFVTLVNVVMKLRRLETCRAIDRKNLLSVFLHMLRSTDSCIQILCLFALNRMLTLNKNCLMIVDLQDGRGVDVLATRAYSGDLRVQSLVCTALCCLMTLPRPLLLKVSATVLPALAHLTLKDNPTLSLKAARGFFNFFYSHEKPNIKLLMAITDKCLKVIFKLMCQEDKPLRIQSFKVLRYISEKTQFIPAIIKLGGLPTLIHLVKDEHEAVGNEQTRREKILRQQIARTKAKGGTLPSLAEIEVMMLDENWDIKDPNFLHGALRTKDVDYWMDSNGRVLDPILVISCILRNVCLRKDSFPPFIDNNGLEALILFMNANNPEVQEMGVRAFVDVAPFCVQKSLDLESFSSDGILSALLSLLHMDNEPGLSQLACECLNRLAHTDEIKCTIIETDAVSSLVKRWVYTTEGVQLAILSLFIRLLSFEDDDTHENVDAGLHMTKTICQSDGLHIMLALGERNDVRFKRRVAKVLGLMAVHESMRKDMAAKGALKLLLVMRTINDKQTKALALECIFRLLENEDILVNESLDSEVSQLMLALSQFGGDKVKKLAGKIVVRLAQHHATLGSGQGNPNNQGMEGKAARRRAEILAELEAERKVKNRKRQENKQNAELRAAHDAAVAREQKLLDQKTEKELKKAEANSKKKKNKKHMTEEERKIEKKYAKYFDSDDEMDGHNNEDAEGNDNFDGFDFDSLDKNNKTSQREASAHERDSDDDGDEEDHKDENDSKYSSASSSSSASSPSSDSLLPNLDDNSGSAPASVPSSSSATSPPAFNLIITPDDAEENHNDNNENNSSPPAFAINVHDTSVSDANNNSNNNSNNDDTNHTSDDHHDDGKASKKDSWKWEESKAKALFNSLDEQDDDLIIAGPLFDKTLNDPEISQHYSNQELANLFAGADLAMDDFVTFEQYWAIFK